MFVSESRDLGAAGYARKVGRKRTVQVPVFGAGILVTCPVGSRTRAVSG
jgi:hypothetical protein